MRSLLRPVLLQGPTSVVAEFLPDHGSLCCRMEGAFEISKSSCMSDEDESC